MRTARSSSHLGGSPPGTPPVHTPPGPGTSPPPGPDTNPVNRITDTCKNITFLQLRLRAVIMAIYFQRRHF